MSEPTESAVQRYTGRAYANVATEPRPSRFDAYGENGVPFPFPCRVVDADGSVIGPCREAHLETGECVVYDIRDGKWQLGDDFRVATKVVQGKAPLHLEALRGPVSG